jgi:hypothetical protein
VAFRPRFESGDGLPKILERGEMRMADPAYEGSATTNEEYIIESIVLPDVYVIEGGRKDAVGEVIVMPAYGDSMTAQDMADILLWLDTFE